MDSDDGVNGLDRLSSRDFDFTGSREGLVKSGMDCVEGFEVFLVWPRQGRVEGVATGQNSSCGLVVMTYPEDQRVSFPTSGVR